MSDDIQEAKISIPISGANTSSNNKKEKKVKATKKTKSNEPVEQTVEVAEQEVINNDISPMKSSILEQKARILEIINNANLFKTSYQQLISNIIPSVNQQLKSYIKNGKKSILVDIRELVIESIDWQAEQDKLVQRLKDNKYINISSTWQHIDKPTATINQFDDDVFTNMLLNCSTENVKEFQKYRKLAKSQLDELINDIDTFEQELCDYRSETVKTMMSNINILFDYHFNYVFDIFNKHKTNETLLIDNKEVVLKKSQKEFITSAIKTLLN